MPPLRWHTRRPQVCNPADTAPQRRGRTLRRMTPRNISPRRRRSRTALAAGALATLSLSTAAALAAGPGDLDPSFGEDGRVVLGASIYPQAVLALPDGKTVLTDTDSPAVVRLAADGTPDRGFSGDGTAVLPFDVGLRAAALPGGKLLVAGAPSLQEIVVARLRPDGQLDATFGPGGDDGDGVQTYGGLGVSTVAGLLVGPDGDIVLAGTERDGYGFGGARLAADGDVELSGFERVPTLGGQPHDAALAPDGKVVVAGSRARAGSADHEIYVTRFTADGKLDTTLGGTGTVLIGEPDRSLMARDVLVEPDGAIVLAVGSGSPAARSLLMRLRADGAPDPAFSDDGTVVPEFVGDDVPAAVTRQPDGKLLLAGTNLTAHEYLVGRFTATGEPDRGFGEDGTAAVAFDDPGGALGADLGADGRLVVAGIVATDNLTRLRPAALRMLTTAPPPVTPPGGGNPGPGAGPGPGPGGDPGPGALPPVPVCAGRPATIVGTGHAETLRGTRGDDVIVARGGRDTIRARGGRDVVCAGGGRDALAGGGGADRLAGGRGRDRCDGGAGRDRLRSCEARARR